MFREAPLEEPTAAAAAADRCATSRTSNVIFAAVQIVVIDATLRTSLEDGHEAVGIDSTTVWGTWG